MKTGTMIVLAVALTLMIAGGAVLVGSHLYASSNDISLYDTARGAGVAVGEDYVNVSVGPVQVDVGDDGNGERVNVRVGPFGVQVDETGVQINGRYYSNNRYSGWKGNNYSRTPDYYDSPVKCMLTFEELDRIDIDSIARDIEITVGEGEGSVVLYERFEGEFSDFKVVDGHLKVHVNENWGNITGGFWSSSNKLEGEEAKIKIVLPASSVKDISIESVSGKVLLDSVTADTISASTVNGALDAENCVIGKTELGSVSGDVRISGGQAGKASLDSVNGGIRLIGASVTGLEAESVNGSIDIELPEQEGSYNFEFESINGRLDLNGASYRSGWKGGAGSIKISLETINGKVTVTTK